MFLIRPTRVHRGNLPHWQTEEGTYFITFRLFDSLPKGVVPRRRKDFEEALDRGHGASYLRRPDVGEMVFRAMKHFHGTRYFLHALCVMPNHVHVVFRTAPTIRMPHVVHTWKSFTAKRANHLLARSGTFWQREPWDHLVRDENDFNRCVAYTLANPEKAGLVNWPWVEEFDTPFQVRYQVEEE